MTKRYYYDRLCEADYMHETFGMELFYGKDRHYDRLYISPECQRHLYPQAFDVLLCTVGDKTHVEYLTQEKDIYTRKNYEIIRRDGKPFIWPKEEEQAKESYDDRT